MLPGLYVTVLNTSLSGHGGSFVYIQIRGVGECKRVGEKEKVNSMTFHFFVDKIDHAI